MTDRVPSRARPQRRSRAPVASLLLAVAAIATAIGYPALSSSTATPTEVAHDERPGTPGARSSPRTERNGRLDEADGLLPDRTTPFDDDLPGVANLDPELLDALRRAARDAAAAGVEVFVESGWRSPAYQKRLLREAVIEHGSAVSAARWVATPTTSAHVSGEAVDIAPVEASAWLSRYGGEYGLCQVFRNEPWHYELRARAIQGGCPPMLADPARDPRRRR